MNITRKFRISLHLLKGKRKARAIGAYAKFTEMPPAAARYLLTQAPHQLCVMDVASFRECVVDEAELNQVEGGEAFPGAGIKLESHIQITVRDPRCIVGFFRPSETFSSEEQ